MKLNLLFERLEKSLFKESEFYSWPQYSKESWDKLKELVGPTDKFIISPDKKINPHIPKKTQSLSKKPQGLWYAVGPEWIYHIKDNAGMEIHQWPYLHKITLNMDKILHITDPNELFQFTKTFGIEKHTKNADNNELTIVEKINWSNVAQQYAGVEINQLSEIKIKPYGNSKYALPLKNHAYLDWYSMWDVASGCVWNPLAIKNVDLIAYLGNRVKPHRNKKRRRY